MPVNCVKMVQKAAKKSAQKSCNLFVQNWQKVEKNLRFAGFAQFINNFCGVLQILFNGFYTRNLAFSSLLDGSFTPFPHRSTITTTLLINKKEYF